MDDREVRLARAYADGTITIEELAAALDKITPADREVARLREENRRLREELAM